MFGFFVIIDPKLIAEMGPFMIIYVLFTLAWNGAKMCVTTANTSFMADIIDYELDRSGRYVPAVVTGTYSLIDKLISSFSAAYCAFKSINSIIPHSFFLEFIGNSSNDSFYRTPPVADVKHGEQEYQLQKFF